MRWLLLAAFSVAMGYSSWFVLYARGEVRTAARLAVFINGANVALSLMLVFRFGAAGLAAGTAITHVLINAFWYTPAACRAAGIRTPELVRALITGNGWLLALLTAEIGIISLARPALPAIGVVIMGIIGGVIYLTVWGLRTAIPLSGLRARTAE